MDQGRERTAGQAVEPARAIAIVSGKGGSGKTSIAAVMAEILDIATAESRSVVIVDADVATAGMTYCLGVKQVDNIGTGWPSLARGVNELSPSLVDNVLRRTKGSRGTFLLPMGDPRRLDKQIPEGMLPPLLAHVVDALRQPGRWVLVDCRGGIDQESLAVCRIVDDIILVVEPDTTSFQATQHLVDVLSDSDLAFKLRGFIINKVFIDPSEVARNGTAVFKCRYLSAVPLDFRSMRAFLVGNVPWPDSVFGIHVWKALARLYPGEVREAGGRTWQPQEFGQVGISDPDSARGGMAVAMLVMALAVAAAADFPKLSLAQPPYVDLAIMLSFAVLAILGSLNPTRRMLGRGVNFYLDAFSRILSRRLER